MIRTLQDRAVAVGHRGLHGVHGHPAGDGSGRADRRVRLLADDAASPIVFPAKAIVLATGGIGKAYEVTSNSWEYSGDGQALAYDAGAELIDMEFVQFHPTGMVWPPGVRGLLVTEAVRGEGGILRNADGERFMWKYLPEDRRAEYAATDEEAAQLGRGAVRRAARPTPAGRPSCRPATTSRAPSTPRSRRAAARPTAASSSTSATCRAEHVRRKLPSMYEQFKELADVDITAGPMEVGPTTHYVMGGIRVDAETGETTVPGLFAAGEVAGGMHGANRLGGNSLSDLLVFGARAGAAAAARAAATDAEPYLDPVQVRAAVAELAAPLERTEGEDPYAIQRELQEMMQRLVGIFRERGRPRRGARRSSPTCAARWQAVRATGGRAYNPGWHLVFELGNLLTISEAVARSARERTESRGAHSRLDYPATDDARWGHLNIVVARGGDGTMTREDDATPRR